MPWLVGADRRAGAGDGAAEALVARLGGGPRLDGRFEVTGWRTATPTGERGFGVDQTNDSVVVGERAVVKWHREAEPGPHPAARRLTTLHERGFTGVPEPWGLVQWRGPGDVAPRLLVGVDGLVPDAVDGWTWAVDDLRHAVEHDTTGPVVSSGRAVGRLLADLHAALSVTARPATAAETARWRDDARDDLARALAATARTEGPAHALLAARADRLGALVVPPPVEGPSVQQVHGDLHVGQLLRSGDALVVTDFDGNPVVPAPERDLPQPTALDVAGLAQSLVHASYVLRRHEPHHPVAAVRRAAEAFVGAFTTGYAERLADQGLVGLHEPALVPGLRLRQVCREFRYAALHLPRWSYVAEAALTDLLP